MTWWTEDEEDYLATHAYMGARAIAGALGRTPAAVRAHAHRMGVALGASWTCPRCGRRSYKPPARGGICRRCQLEDSTARTAERNRRVREEAAREEAEIQAAERRRAALYSDTARQKQRLRKLRRFHED